MDDLAKLKLPGVFIMAGREQSHTSKPGMDPKPQGDIASKGAQTHGGQGDLPKEREHGVKSGDQVGRDEFGRDVPDSKERSTEIAVEEGRKGRGEHHDDKR
jgi:hypothetical protein